MNLYSGAIVRQLEHSFQRLGTTGTFLHKHTAQSGLEKSSRFKLSARGLKTVRRHNPSLLLNNNPAVVPITKAISRVRYCCRCTGRVSRDGRLVIVVRCQCPSLIQLQLAAGERAPRGEGGGSRWGRRRQVLCYNRLGGVAKAMERQAGPAPAGLGKGLDRGYIIKVVARPFAVMTGTYEGRILYNAKGYGVDTAQVAIGLLVGEDKVDTGSPVQGLRRERRPSKYQREWRKRVRIAVMESG